MSTSTFDEYFLRQKVNNYSENIHKNISNFFMYENKDGYIPVFFSISPIVNNNTINGYVVVIYNHNKLQSILNINNFGENIWGLMADDNNGILAFPYSEIKTIEGTSKYKNLLSQIKLAFKDKAQHKMIDISTTEMLVYSSKMDYFNFSLVTMIDSDTISGDIDKIIRKINILTINLIILIISIVIIFCSIYFRPLEYLLASSKSKSSGKKFTKLKINTNNELTHIIDACNKMADEISERDERYRAIVEMNDNIVFEYDILKDDVAFSKNFNTKFSFRPKTFKFYDSFLNKCKIHPDDRANYDKFINTAFLDKETAQAEFRFKTLFDDYVWFIIRCTLLFDKEKLPTKMIGIMVDIDSAKKFERNLIKRAEFDGLTGLFNRETFEKRLSAEYRLYQKRKNKTAVMFVDIDDFKHFNDDFSHACGDEVLTFISQTINEVLDNEGFAGRYGGDEFVICYNSSDSKENTHIFAQSLITRLSQGFDCISAECHLSVNCSIGISYFNEDKNNSTNVIDEADEAMYSVKKHGKSNYKEYNN